MARTRSEVAGLSARMCAIWADATSRRLHRVMRLEPTNNRRALSADEQDELLGEAFLVVVALGDALTWRDGSWRTVTVLSRNSTSTSR